MNDTERLNAIFNGIIPSFQKKFDAAGRGKDYKAYVGLSKDCIKEAIAEAAEKTQPLLAEARIDELKRHIKRSNPRLQSIENKAIQARIEALTQKQEN